MARSAATEVIMARAIREFSVEITNLRQFYRELRDVDKTVAAELRKELRKIGNETLDDVRAEALRNLPRSISTRAVVRSAYQLKVDPGGDGVEVRVKDRPAALANNSNTKVQGKYMLPRLFEAGSRRNRNQIRFPVFPKKGTTRGEWTWRFMPLRPSVGPVLVRNRRTMLPKVKAALERAAAKINR
jgi:hypothetical protein